MKIFVHKVVCHIYLRSQFFQSKVWICNHISRVLDWTNGFYRKLIMPALTFHAQPHKMRLNHPFFSVSGRLDHFCRLAWSCCSYHEPCRLYLVYMELINWRPCGRIFKRCWFPYFFAFARFMIQNSSRLDESVYFRHYLNNEFLTAITLK